MLNFIGRPFICLLAGLLLGTALVTSHGALAAGESGGSSSSASRHPDLDYLKAVNSVAPPREPELLFLLMAGYSNASLQGEGAEFFSARLKEFDSRLTAAQKALYLSAIGLLRAQHASSISLLHRVGYVKLPPWPLSGPALPRSATYRNQKSSTNPSVFGGLSTTTGPSFRLSHAVV
jgi:hypothetical protein